MHLSVINQNTIIRMQTNKQHQTRMNNIVICTSLAVIALVAGVSCKPAKQSENLDGDYVQTFVPLRRNVPNLTQAASDEASVPVYVSPYARSDEVSANNKPYLSEESSHAPLNYAMRPAASNQGRDLKTSASYGHGHGHHGGGYHDHGGWLDMGAWTGGKGSFGWYADYPVGKGHGYGRR